MDDRAGIQLLGGVVTGGPDQLHTSVVGTPVGIRSGKGWKQGVMDIDHPVVMLRAEPSGKDLHVATENGKLSRDIADGIAHPSEGGILPCFIAWNRNMEERQTFFLNRGTQGIMV